MSVTTFPEFLGVRMTKEMLGELRLVALVTDRSVSGVVRAAITKELVREGFAPIASEEGHRIPEVLLYPSEERP